MNALDWAVVAAFFAISIALAGAARTKAGQTLDGYFRSNRGLGWWLAGTSIAATAFSSDTPLLITGMIRQRGLWGAWEVWALGISTMLAVFVFARLWKRADVMTEVALVELRYGGRPAAWLRGVKALYWGLFYNCYIIGVWPVVGMSKVLEETTGLPRTWTIVGSVLVGTVYTSWSGLWGVVVTDAFQFVWAMAGAALLAVFAVQAVGGLDALSARLADTGLLQVIPPVGDQGWFAPPFGWFLGLICIQWWAWKNADGGGIIVQRLVSCKDERQAMRSILWFNIAHYALRSWPWVLTALASVLLIPDAALINSAGAVDHERAYPRLIMMLLPAGLRGVLLAAFFAAFVSTLSSQLNWGASYLVNDFYKRFIRRDATERHYLRVAELMPFVLAAGAMAVAFMHWNIGASFTFVLNLTAGIGPVLLARWFWWRVNAWSEIAAMAASLPVLLLRPTLLAWCGVPPGTPLDLLAMVVGTALVWVPVTLLTPPVDRGLLKAFYARVQPPGWWRHVAVARPGAPSWGPAIAVWLLGTVALLGTTVGPLQVWLRLPGGWWVCATSAAAWIAAWCLWRSQPIAGRDTSIATPR